jgi:hypothetical protein
MMPAPVLMVPVKVPPVVALVPPARVPPEPVSNTEELPLLPQPPAKPHTTPAASMHNIVAFPYLMIPPP